MGNRQFIRLKDYDYASTGLYYITLCTQDRRQVFGEIKKDEMFRSWVGDMVQKAWLELPRYDSRISLDEFMVMPDHFHGIIVMNDMGCDFRDGQARGPAPTIPRIALSLPDLIQPFKSWTTRQYWDLGRTRGRLWQRNYYEHIVRDDDDLHRIREYIKNNPKNWAPHTRSIVLQNE